MNHSRRFVLILVVTLVSACNRSAEASKAEPPVAANELPPTAAIAPPAVASNVADAPLKLTRNSDGSIRVQFTDRWGTPSDMTYESLQFLERATPTLSRAMSDERAAELKHQLTAFAKPASK